MFPVDRDSDGFEDGFDGRGSFLADSVSWNQSNSVASPKLRIGGLRKREEKIKVGSFIPKTKEKKG